MGARESRVLLPKGSLPFPGPRSAQPCSLAAQALSHVAQSAGPNGEGNDEFPLAPHCASGLTRLSAQIHSKLGGGYLQWVRDFIYCFKSYSLGVFYYYD